jgi:hypothetical protein
MCILWRIIHIFIFLYFHVLCVTIIENCTKDLFLLFERNINMCQHSDSCHYMLLEVYLNVSASKILIFCFVKNSRM